LTLDQGVHASKTAKGNEQVAGYGTVVAMSLDASFQKFADIGNQKQPSIWLADFGRTATIPMVRLDYLKMDANILQVPVNNLVQTFLDRRGWIPV
jgi:hypothetical protein